MANRWGKSGWLYFGGLQNHCRWWWQSWIKRRLLLGRKVMTNLDSILKKQRHYFASKGLSTQGYGFSSGYVWMWELDCEESWAPKYWSFSLSISPSNEYPGLVSFRMDWLDLLAVQGTLKSLLQHHSSKASILWCSAFFTVQLSHPYMTTGKTIALSRQTFVGKVISSAFQYAI